MAAISTPNAAIASVISLNRTGKRAGVEHAGALRVSHPDFDASLEHLQRGQRAQLGNNAINDVARYHLAQLWTRASNFEAALGVLAELAQSGRETQAWILQTGLAGLWKPILPADLPTVDRELVYLAGRAFRDAAARNSPAAQKGFRILLDKYPQAPGVHYLFGSFALVESPDDALPAFEAELKISPKHAGALAAIAAEYLRRGEPQTGLSFGKQCVEVVPRSHAAHAIYGKLLAETGDLEGGLAELERARDLGPEDPQPRIALASLYAKLGRNQDAARERKEFQRLTVAAKKPGEQ